MDTEEGWKEHKKYFFVFLEDILIPKAGWQFVPTYKVQGNAEEKWLCWVATEQNTLL